MEALENTTANQGDHCPRGIILPLVDESEWAPAFRGFVYFVALLYALVGVSVVTDVFMGAVLTITSKTKKVYVANRQKIRTIERAKRHMSPEELDFIEVRIWNDTVANLTLMALGTSAPEILLACIEVISHSFESGELGPGTIVGSGAFNLLMITAVCILSIPRGETRKIRLFTVFLVCSCFSIFAYIWVWMILSFISPNEVELWEAVITFLMFPGLVFFAYATDKGWFGCTILRSKNKRQFDVERTQSDESEKMLGGKKYFKDGRLDRESLIKFVKEIRKYPGVTDEDAAVLAASKVVTERSMSTMHYKINAIRALTGGRKIRPRLTMKLQEVYDAINQNPNAPDIGTVPDLTPETHAVIEFQSATCAVLENIGTFSVTVWRHGNLDPVVKVRVESVDGSAKAGEDYVKVDETITFQPGETIKQVEVTIIDDNQWEPDEEFFLKLSLVDVEDEDHIQLGRITIMEITIIDDDEPGIISFEKRGILVKQSADSAIIQVKRKHGADGDVSVKWRTIDGTAKSGEDYYGGEGELFFKHTEVLKTIDVPLINDLRPERDECFEVELYDPTNNAVLGSISRIFVTITNDSTFAKIADEMLAKATATVESLAVFRKTWTEQIKDAMNVNGGDIEGATPGDYFLHFVSFNWKVLFSLIPPPTFLGGWLCFFISLAGIGFVTALIGDIAKIFGCVVGLGEAMTAITFVALGTSLPDTFASRIAALKEDTADASVGNIMGSNSVNVFLGLGLPWCLATLYHTYKGTKFIVPAGTLGFSVLLFSLSAFIATGLLILRRYLTFTGKAELGGPLLSKIISSGILFLLWVFYISFSFLQEYGIIHANF